jgi:hypothetical protein
MWRGHIRIGRADGDLDQPRQILPVSKASSHGRSSRSRLHLTGVQSSRVRAVA